MKNMTCLDHLVRSPRKTCPEKFSTCSEDEECKDCAAVFSKPPDACKAENGDGFLTCEEGGNMYCCYFEDDAACLENENMLKLLGALLILSKK